MIDQSEALLNKLVEMAQVLSAQVNAIQQFGRDMTALCEQISESDCYAEFAGDDPLKWADNDYERCVQDIFDALAPAWERATEARMYVEILTGIMSSINTAIIIMENKETK